MTTRHIPSRPTGHNPFLVPDNYFEEFQEKMMKRLTKVVVIPASKPVKEMPVVRWLPYLGAACVAALTLVFTRVAPLEGTALPGGIAVEQASVSSYEDEAYDYLNIYDSETLASYVSDY